VRSLLIKPLQRDEVLGVGFLVAYIPGVDKLPSKVLCGTKGAIKEGLDLKSRRD
jgi:hypothetical protein